MCGPIRFIRQAALALARELHLARIVSAKISKTEVEADMLSTFFCRTILTLKSDVVK
jgi:hypothetical protein